MNPGLTFFILLNNYFHDIATALLLASGVTVWIIIREPDSSGNPDIRAFVQSISKSVGKIVFFALTWISLSAVPRILAFTRLEWASAHNKNQVPELTVKHILAFIIVVSGSCLWISISRTMKSVVDPDKAPEAHHE